jgi:hypothetical protein
MKMTAAQKKAFVARMARARAGKKQPTKKKKKKKKNPGNRFLAKLKRLTPAGRKEAQLTRKRLAAIAALAGKARRKNPENIGRALYHLGYELGASDARAGATDSGTRLTDNFEFYWDRLNAPKTADKTALKKLFEAAWHAGHFHRPRRPPKQKNPEHDEDMLAAEAMYEQFHGRAAERTIEHSDAHEYRSELAELGNLLELRVRVPGVPAPVPIRNFGADCQATCTPDGNTIYFLGGDQRLDLAGSLGIESDKDYVELGEATYVQYFSKKGFHNFAPTNYFHSFGEEDGIRPVLAYDAINEKLFLVGGNYHCKPEGIVN